MARKHPHALVHPFRITLVAFIEDLGLLEETGLEQHQCDAVVACLDSVIDHLRRAPANSTWLSELLAPFSSLRTEYFHWNNPRAGSHPASHRAAQCKQIRKQKDGMLPRYKFGDLWATAEERRVFLNVYDEFIRLESIQSRSQQHQQPRETFKKTVDRAKEKRQAIEVA